MKTICGSVLDPTVVLSTGKVLLLKMLHSPCKEFMITSRMLETMKGGKTVDTDIALRAKLKTYTSEKQLT